MRQSLARALALMPLALVPSVMGSTEPVGFHQVPAPGAQDAEDQAAEVVLGTASAFLLEDQKAVIITTSNGFVRRVDLKSLEASHEAREHEGSGRWISVSQLNDGRLLTLDSAGVGHLREAETLKSVGRFSVGGGYGQRAVGPKGKQLARVSDRTHVAVSKISQTAEEPELIDCEGDVRDLVFSSSGDQLFALLEHGYYLIQDGKRSDLCRLPVGFEARMALFLGKGRLAIGSNAEGDNLPEVLIWDLMKSAEERRIEAPYHAAPLGGFVSSMQYYPEMERLTFGVSSAGSVIAVNPWTGERHWDIGFGGGNPGGIGVTHAKGSKRCFSHGMTASHRAAFSWESGERLSAERLHGYSSLCGTADDRTTIGVANGQLVLLDSETYDPLRLRTELAKPLGGRVEVLPAGR